MNKTALALTAMQNGEVGKSLSIFKTFRIGFTKDEHRILEMASDIMHGSVRFYQQLGYDTAAITAKAREIVRAKYNV